MIAKGNTNHFFTSLINKLFYSFFPFHHFFLYLNSACAKGILLFHPKQKALNCLSVRSFTDEV